MDNWDGRSFTPKFSNPTRRFVLGQAVKVRSESKYAAEWPGTFFVTGLQWNYQPNRLNYGTVTVDIASDNEITAGYGSTTEFMEADLEPA